MSRVPGTGNSTCGTSLTVNLKKHPVHDVGDCVVVIFLTNHEVMMNQSVFAVKKCIVNMNRWYTVRWD